ncbi:hypothetical protein ACIBK1_06465 [Microbispora rosea]|uniref:hypothetical protein n=1 Tax=Microbispora rosea TaxID=58117 RepID=UPI0037A58398
MTPSHSASHSPSYSPSRTPSPDRPSPTPSRSASARPSPTPSNATTPPRTGDWPGPGNTGVPAGVALKRSDSLVITKDGTVIDGLDVYGDITVDADNVTIRNTRVRGQRDYWGILQREGRSGLTVEDVEVFGNGKVRTQFGILNQGKMITIRRVDIHTISNGICTEQGVVEDSYLHDPKYYSGDHTDMIMSTSAPAKGTQLIIRNNTVINTLDQTGAIALFQDFGVIRDVTVEGNLLAGGGWALYAGAGTKGTSSNVKVIDNVFSRQIWPKGGHAGPVAYWDHEGSGNVWQGNIWEDGGVVDPGKS